MASAGVTPRSSRPSTTPHASRTPYSVGQAHPHSRLSPRVVSNNARSPSPNYFGLTIDPAKEELSSGGGVHVKQNWSPPTSNVRSTAAASPRVIPLDQNPEFEAFRRASEHNYNAVKLSSFNVGGQPIPRRTTSKSGSISYTTPLSPSQIMLPPSPRVIPGVETKFSEHKQRSPKRLLSSPVPYVTDRPRRNSPAGFNERDSELAPQIARFLEEERDLRHSLPADRATTPLASALHQRADTLPGNLEDQIAGDSKQGGPTLISPQQVNGIIEAQPSQTLIIDVRVSTQYAKSRIKGALNLCIPTTLLKRPAYNTDKLADTFKSEEHRQKFENWRNCNTIIIYDASSSKLKDATACLKMLEKFSNEGWSGASLLIRGGFLEFSRKFPALISHGFEGAAPGIGEACGGLAPVIGGCPMPQTENAANPFFSNIRQNMDLIGGVGQIPLHQPSSMSNQQKDDLPRWLKRAASETNQGKAVSEKFLVLEQKEQKRMQQALSSKVSFGTPRPGDDHPVQLAGIEKGAKNRYNNIWPYEHSRVKLEGIPSHGCDYVNASHIKTQWSNKRYIATQGPIPATFADFWNVVWQQDVRVIVMLTAEKENGQLKAHNYWSDRHYGPFSVHFHSEHRASLEPSKIHKHRADRPPTVRRRSTHTNQSKSHGSDSLSPTSDHPYVTVRNFTISNSEEPFEQMREVTQLHYTGWPDFGAPAHPAHLLGLVEQCDAVTRTSYGGHSSNGFADENERPVLVHCSAGCGRTGTFCTVDSVIDMIKHQRFVGNPRGNHPSSPDGRGHSRNARQPTPMDLDPRSRQSSFASNNSPPSQSMFLGHVNGDAMSEVTGNEWLYRDDVDLIEKAVNDFRLQRISMVQSLRQFVLCYESVLEWLAEDNVQGSA